MPPERGSLARLPGKTERAMDLTTSISRTISSARLESGTRCSRQPSCIVPSSGLKPGMVQIRPATSISSQRAPIASLDRPAVQNRELHAPRGNRGRFAQPTDKCGNIVNRRSAVAAAPASCWSARGDRDCHAKQPGSRPVRKLRALAASSTFSILPRTRFAVSCFVCQIGLSTASTSSVRIWSTGIDRSDAAYVH